MTFDLFAFILLASIMAALAYGLPGFYIATVTGRDWLGNLAGLACLACLVNAAAYAPTEHPDRMAERATYAQVAGIWAGALRDSLSCQDHPVPYARPVHVGEDMADEQVSAWLDAARSVDVTP